MPDWKAKLENIFERIEDVSDDFRLKRKRKRNFENPLMIMPFFGYGTSEKIRIKGRVVEDEGAIASTETDSVWRNIANMYRRFETDEIPHAKVRAIFQNNEIETIADREGYFTAEFNSVGNLPEKVWQEVGFELLEPVSLNRETAKAVGQILTPALSAKFGVISDIDDTVMATNVMNRLKMLITTIAANEHTRIPFEGVAAFYRALQKGAGGAENNPIFYVSSSPWNLYGFLLEFFKKHEIPFGPLFLKDFGSHTIFSGGEHQTHKLENIAHILETFAHLPFVLIGDSGEQDPEIYRQIVEKYPNRIRAVYIRDVNPNPERVAAIDKLILEITEIGSQLVFAPDSEFAARHAVAEGLITADELENIRVEKKIDEAAPTVSEILSEEAR
jgi:phosphatidate phosphatase APP1